MCLGWGAQGLSHVQGAAGTGSLQAPSMVVLLYSARVFHNEGLCILSGSRGFRCKIYFAHIMHVLCAGCFKQAARNEDLVTLNRVLG